MAKEFRFVLDLGGRVAASRKLRAMGIETATPSNMYNWVRRSSLPSDVMRAVIDMKHEKEEHVEPKDFDLVEVAGGEPVEVNEASGYAA